MSRCKPIRLTPAKVAQIQRGLNGLLGGPQRLSIGVAHANGINLDHARKRAWSRIVELNLQTK